MQARACSRIICRESSATFLLLSSSRACKQQRQNIVSAQAFV